MKVIEVYLQFLKVHEGSRRFSKFLGGCAVFRGSRVFCEILKGSLRLLFLEGSTDSFRSTCSTGYKKSAT